MKSIISIPDFYREKLNNSIYDKLVQEFLDAYSWISKNETIFFREYTNHGLEHIEGVLETSLYLLASDSKKIITDADVALLIISTLLHDIALHIKEDQFIKLVDEELDYYKIKGLDFESWYSLWVKFAAEASRFNNSQLQFFFGSDKPIPIPSIKSYQDWDQRQYKLIGEFLRRYHPRLAHEFAVFGFPIIKDGVEEFKKIQDSKFDKFIDLAGLVARSHGTSLRSLFSYLKNEFGNIRIQDNTHAIYVMVLLRIADFLQLQKSRASKAEFEIKNFQSPLSRREWSVHFAIDSINYDQHEDPETVEVIVNYLKVNISLYLRIDELLSQLQKELDYSWAVLGEVYGRYNKQKMLGITIRRVRSNIDDKIKFGLQAGFVPQKASFTAADAELLKLFIKPLYGDKPEIAVRELIQNSIDAVRERLLLEGKDDLNDISSVIVSISKIDEDKWMLRVEDKGTGMTLHTIINYFLNAGASYRLSNVWKENFLDEHGKAKVLRSGRFGVGALAAFMLAEDPTRIQLKVFTRHFLNKPSDAYEFFSTLSDSPIQIQYVSKDEPGTTIEIITSNPPAFMQEASKDSNDKNWDWYCLDKPIVERIGLNGKKIPQSITLPSSPLSSSYDYHWIYPKDYEFVGWSYSDFPSVVCNGIIIQDKTSEKYYSLESGKFNQTDINIEVPSLSIFDRDGYLPITLDRLKIDYNQLQFLGELRQEIKKNILAFLLVNAPVRTIISDTFFYEAKQKTHPALKKSIGNLPWILTKKGALLYCPELFCIVDAKSIVEIHELKDLKDLLSHFDFDTTAFVINPSSLWSMLEGKPAIVTGYRLKSERKKISTENFTRIKNILDNCPPNVDIQLVPQSVVENYLKEKFSNDYNSEFKLIELIRREIHLKGDRQSSYLLLLDDSNIEKLVSNKELFFDDLKQILYKLNNIKAEIKKSELKKIIDDLVLNNRKKLNRNSTNDILNQITHEINHLNDLSRDLYKNNSHSFFQEIKSQIKNEKLYNCPTSDLQIILGDLRELRIMPMISELEKFGELDSNINWHSIERFILIKDLKGIPVVEFALNKEFAYDSANNFLAQIWLEFIGHQVIPFDQSQREALIDSIQEKTDIKKHIVHWKNVIYPNK